MTFRLFSNRYGLFAVLAVAAIMGFQNCGEPFQLESSTNFSQTDPDSQSEDSLTPGDPTDPEVPMPENGESEPQLSVQVFSSPTASTDCSRPTANFAYLIQNASLDLLACWAYTLVMPGFPRDNETYVCDEEDKFVALKDLEEWAYDAETMQWSLAQNLRNHPNVVPGDYTLMIREPSGPVVSSEVLVIRRNDAENCSQ